MIDVFREDAAGIVDQSKLPHFHIKSVNEGWDIRMLMDGTFISTGLMTVMALSKKSISS